MKDFRLLYIFQILSVLQLRFNSLMESRLDLMQDRIMDEDLTSRREVAFDTLVQDASMAEDLRPLTYEPDSDSDSASECDFEVDVVNLGQHPRRLTYGHQDDLGMLDQHPRRLTYGHQDDLGMLDQLTEMEEQANRLEKMLSTVTEDSRFGSSWDLHMQLKALQAQMRGVIIMLRGRSKGNFWRSSLSRSMLDAKELLGDQMRAPFSCPDIPSLLEDIESITKSKSLNRSINLSGVVVKILDRKKILDKSFKRIIQQYHQNRPQQEQPDPAYHGPIDSTSPSFQEQSNHRPQGQANSSSLSPQAAGSNVAGSNVRSEMPSSNSLRTRGIVRGTTNYTLEQDRRHHSSALLARPTTQSTAAGSNVRSEMPSSNSLRTRGIVRGTTNYTLEQDRRHHSSAMLARPTTQSTIHRALRLVYSLLPAWFSLGSGAGNNDSGDEPCVKVMKVSASDEPNGSPSFFVHDISTTICKTMAACCAVILIFLEF